MRTYTLVALLFAISVAGPAAASKEEIMSAYKAYIAAEKVGDAKKALLFAEEAYTLALADWGAAEKQTGILASNYASQLANVGRERDAAAAYEKCVELLGAHTDAKPIKLGCIFEIGNLAANKDSERATERFREVIEEAGAEAKTDKELAHVVGRSYVSLAFLGERDSNRLIPRGTIGSGKTSSRIEPAPKAGKTTVDEMAANAASAAEYLEIAEATDTDYYANALWLKGAASEAKEDSIAAGELYAKSANVMSTAYGPEDRRTIEMLGREKYAAYLELVAEDSVAEARLTRQPSGPDCRVELRDGVEMELCVEIRFRPRFPHSELYKGQQGFALISYDVTEKGIVENAKSEIDWPGGVFTERAMKFVTTSKYFPPTDPSGGVRRVIGTQTMVRFICN